MSACRALLCTYSSAHAQKMFLFISSKYVWIWFAFETNDLRCGNARHLNNRKHMKKFRRPKFVHTWRMLIYPGWTMPAFRKMPRRTEDSNKIASKNSRLNQSSFPNQCKHQQTWNHDESSNMLHSWQRVKYICMCRHCTGAIVKALIMALLSASLQPHLRICILQ